MLRSAVLVVLAASASPAFAQGGCDVGAAGVTLNQYVEARRPVLSNRKLTAQESAEAGRLAAQIRSDLKSKTRSSHAALDRLGVLAASGDRELMKVVMEGYNNAGPVKVIDDTRGETFQAGVMLAALWAVQLWREGERGKPVSAALDNCVQRDSYGSEARTRCGFSAKVAFDGRSTFNGHWTGQTGQPKSATFSEFPLVQTSDQERARFEKALIEYRNASGSYGQDYNWASCWAKLQGGDYLGRWSASEQLAAANYQTNQLNTQLRKQAEIDQKAGEWTALQARRVEARAGGGALSEADEGKWASLSFWLGGKYLLPYASETVLLSETAIDSLCRADGGKVCQRQKQLYQYRAEAARSEQNMREAALRNMTLGGRDVTVRNYDQNGNYLGTTTMPAWQADIAGAR